MNKLLILTLLTPFLLGNSAPVGVLAGLLTFFVVLALGLGIIWLLLKFIN